MAEQTAVFAGMISREGNAFSIVAALAMFFCLFFAHGKKGCMILIMGHFGGGLFRGSEEEGKQPSAEEYEEDV